MIDERLRKGIGMTSERTRQRLVERLREGGITNDRVLQVIRDLPRHLFVDEALASRAYDDTALPIGLGQTISQPYVVARMTEALIVDGEGGDMLEVGTGSGYQAAVLARFASMVYSVERIGFFAQQARQRLRSLGVHNVRVRHGDGYEGWIGQGPFRGIVVTAAPNDVPSVLLDQLALGGRLVAPVGDRERQELVCYTRHDDGYEREVLAEVSFVPMLGGTQ
ncbi:protein-L-isoaspartate(D-aspartate) O-methyltransferase [Natronocella acetinitrilica]|uniref:Protein-L-isoaspartate O-methyltransferase n=1 Tax=Natronocella acetinitrilica TaxID=414046 RepID=A0AAE3KCW4_9GAMM|nr:protein-L-isoaspartate(D-aspartate) O-methyltransferase [Natronocella acetinitrilica]MCP1676176.1 protein-L-isoaspartate(D-aspartate) O-methyltransferase [Natronocella acetinitrilica]